MILSQGMGGKSHAREILRTQNKTHVSFSTQALRWICLARALVFLRSAISSDRRFNLVVRYETRSTFA